MNARRGSASDALARMQRAAAAPSPATRTPDPELVEAAQDRPDPATAGPARPAPEQAPRPTRTTLDLDTDRYVALKAFSARHRAKGAEVLRALLDELQHDPQLSATIADRLTNDRKSLR